jgi:hypothetical protein
MTVAMLLLSYLLLMIGSAVPTALLTFEVMDQIRRGQPWCTRFTVEFSVVAALSTILQCITNVAATHPEIPALMTLSSSIFAVLVAACLWWVYDALREPVPNPVITQPAVPVLGETEVALRRSVASMAAQHIHGSMFIDEVSDALPGTASPYETLPIIDVAKEVTDEQQ